MRERKQRKQRKSSQVTWPMTVREAQIVLRKNNKKSKNIDFLNSLVVAINVDWFSSWGMDGEEVVVADEVFARLDQLASKNPNQVLLDEYGFFLTPENENEIKPKGEDREKGTEDVSPTSSTPSEDSLHHGGNGNSGECDATAETTNDTSTNKGGNGSLSTQGQSQRDSDPKSLPQDQGDEEPQDSLRIDSLRSKERDEGVTQDCSETGNATSESPAASENSQSLSSRAGESFSTAMKLDTEPESKPDLLGTPNQPRDDGGQEPGDFHESNMDSEPGREEDPDCQMTGNKTGGDRPTHQKKWGKKLNSSRGGGKPSYSNNNNRSWRTAELKGLKVSPKLMKLCRKRLSALTGDSNEDESPRRDYVDFCTRLKTFRNPQPARKEEIGRPVLLLLADVSGSCSGFSDQSVLVGKAASKLGVPGTDIIVVSHSNGWAQEVEINGKEVSVDSIDSSGIAIPWFSALLRRFPIEAVVALGDWDAVQEYSFLIRRHQIKKFIWLDNAHCSSRGTVQDRSKWALSMMTQYGVKPATIRYKFTYRDGCKTASDFIENIK